MTIFMPPNKARTIDFNANDVGYVPRVADHYKTDQYVDTSSTTGSDVAPELVTSHLNIDEATIKKISVENQAVIAG
jgi:oxalate decarboxylase